ncbi:hypothetical protein M427DRAFT_42051 [Gonapodya prolifera JEL478]|uniref:Methyltransferase domain-containing protein n=1 Tax=Gonapodya prolifera (strain JEL478) TaxID=1344416 RepID=A0A139AR93_GONPJ|nr:hypothetical protein M427DRAFT_42051 [Gonapodya prolifera JEL478]|eukprot:KXS19258.1 hypothetical protein M427DRAFT_42051 [Gonapodya prolifera JEL478]
MAPAWTPSRTALSLGIILTIFITATFLFADDLYLLRAAPPCELPPPSFQQKPSQSDTQRYAVGSSLREQGVHWDAHSAVFALMFRFNKNQYACKALYSLGGAPSGDGVWPVCFDAWEQVIFTNPSHGPAWLKFKPKPKHGRRDVIESASEISERVQDLSQVESLRGRHGARASRRAPTQGIYFRPGSELQQLDKANAGLEREPEPLTRPPEGQTDLRNETIFGHAASQAELGNDPPCVVYTFGVDWDFSWEDEFHNMTGCETHSFDPSMDMESHYRGRNQWFWNRGIAAESQTTTGVGLRTGKETVWEVLTLSDHLKRLGHAHIDLLKIDVEGYEWDTLARAFEDGVMDHVEQVLFEVHMFPQFFRKWRPTSPSGSPPADVPSVSQEVQDVEGILGWVELLDKFEKSGFVQYYHHTNPMSIQSKFGEDRDINNLPCCFELAFVRKR